MLDNETNLVRILGSQKCFLNFIMIFHAQYNRKRVWSERLLNVIVRYALATMSTSVQEDRQVQVIYFYMIVILSTRYF